MEAFVSTLVAVWEFIDLPVVIFLMLNVFLVTASLLVYAERKVSAFIQERNGPDRVGPRGLLQSFADVFKLLFKEDIVPAAGNKFIHSLAPTMMVVIAMSTGSLVPWARTPGGDALAIADIGVGLLVVLAMTYKGPAAVMAEVARMPAFAGATHDAMGLLGVALVQETADAA